MVTPLRPKCPKVLSRDNRDTIGLHETNTQECLLDENKTTPKINSLAFRRTGRVQQHFFPRKEGARCLHKCVWRARHTLLLSNRAISNTIQTRQQVRHGHDINRQQWHTSASHEDQKRCRDFSSLRRSHEVTPRC